LFVLAILLACGLAVSATGDLQERMSEPGQDLPVVKPFKMKAAGAIDLTTGEVAIGGVATHLGLFTATGFLLPDFSIFGTFEAANGDTLDFTALFDTGPIGEIQAIFNFTGGTGRFADAVGMASGPVMLDPDFTFLIKAEGDIDY
jgi:hypothetical protein